MATFIETPDGTLINIENISCIDPIEESNGRYCIFIHSINHSALCYFDSEKEAKAFQATIKLVANKGVL